MSSASAAPLSALTRPGEVRTNRNSGLIRLLACALMLVDHAGKMLFPQYPVMRVIGRLAFPMFAYGIAVGAVYTRDPLRYLSRVALLALVSQPLYALGLAHENAAMYAYSFAHNPLRAAYAFYMNSWQTPSILLSLALSLSLILCLRGGRYALALGVYVLCTRFSANLDYGIQGVHLTVLFYLLCEHPLAALAGTSAFMLWWAQGGGYEILGHEFSIRIFALPAAIFCCLPMKRGFRLPKWFTYGFYPAHLLALWLLARFSIFP